jgi:hypothetical protein
VIPARNNDQLLVKNHVDEPIRLIDPPRPAPGQAVLQRFRLAYPSKRIPLRVLDQVIDALEGFSILRLPVDVAVPGFIRELQVSQLSAPLLQRSQ